jgi:hypothetical protein
MNTADSKFVSNGVTTAYDAVKAKVASANTLDDLQSLFNEAVSDEFQVLMAALRPPQLSHLTKLHITV